MIQKMNHRKVKKNLHKLLRHSSPSLMCKKSKTLQVGEEEESEEEDFQKAYGQLYSRSLEIIKVNSKLKKEINELKETLSHDYFKLNALLEKENKNLKEKAFRK